VWLNAHAWNVTLGPADPNWAINMDTSDFVPTQWTMAVVGWGDPAWSEEERQSTYELAWG
jgi:hypothetical protein